MKETNFKSYYDTGIQNPSGPGKKRKDKRSLQAGRMHGRNDPWNRSAFRNNSPCFFLFKDDRKSSGKKRGFPEGCRWVPGRPDPAAGKIIFCSPDWKETAKKNRNLSRNEFYPAEARRTIIKKDHFRGNLRCPHTGGARFSDEKNEMILFFPRLVPSGKEVRIKR